MKTWEGLHRFVDPVDDEIYLYTQFEVSDARRVFACFEQPDLKATYQLTVTAPAHWRVISISPTPAPEPAGEGIATWAFEPTERISTYLMADRKSTRLNSSHVAISYAVFCLKKKNTGTER